jgi:hypothetical protein
LEQGGVFHTLGITNFLEGDLFAWYLAAWTAPVEKLVRAMVTKLDLYNPGTFSEDPAQSRDLLKKLYQQLFPKSVRHDLGEYYTPDWLAEHVLNELGYEGDPDKRLLDPACGSGTFLVVAINRIRRWYDLNREKCAYDEGDLLKKILANVIGFDLNPLAVMAARTNYLVAIKDLIRRVDTVEIPVFLCDSILTPSQAGSHDAQMSFLTEAGVRYDPSHPPIAVKTAADVFLVPSEIATSRTRIGKYSEVLELCVRNKYRGDDFVARCQEEGLPVAEYDLHRDFYGKLQKLDAENRNGVWARIIKNAFAPLFVGTVDYVAGNPPWVNWEHLPEDYRTSMIPLYEHKYGLFPETGLRRRHGSARIDISSLMAYVASDVYLSLNGKLGFLITESLFSTDAGKGFRGLELPDGTPLGLEVVHDMVALKPFEGVANRTSAFVWKRGVKTSPPVRFVTWQHKPNCTIDDTLDLRTVTSFTARKETGFSPASADNFRGNWIRTAAPGMENLFGQSDYVAHAGSYTGGANAVYWVRVVDKPSKHLWVVQNVTEGAKRKVERQEFAVEEQLLYPLLREGGVQRWAANPEGYVLIPQDPDDVSRAMPEELLKRKYPHAYSYFKKNEGVLAQRQSQVIRDLANKQGFWFIYSVKDYTMSTAKLVWSRFHFPMRACVIGTLDGRPIIPQETITLVALDSAEEGHFLCSLMNSLPFNAAAKASSQVGGKSFATPQLLTKLRLPKYDRNDPVPRRLAALSRDCHAAAAKGDVKQVASLEPEVDNAAAKLWGITDDELKAIRDDMAETGTPRGAAEEDQE